MSQGSTSRLAMAACLPPNTTLYPLTPSHPPPLRLIHVAFFDTRPSPDVANMRAAAQLCKRSTASAIQFHALLSVPITIRGFLVTVLALPPRAQCIYDKLRLLAHGPGTRYLYKPLIPWALRGVDKVIVLDTDAVVLNDLSHLWAEFERFNGALIGVSQQAA